jgi:RNA polymerase sigma factor (sigma-70 family)
MRDNWFLLGLLWPNLKIVRNTAWTQGVTFIAERMAMPGDYRDDSSKVPTEAELEALLDEQSDEEFGQTELEVASVDQRAVLKDWSAQDFAAIYVRFRPHLERHARRFLRNPSQVDEVVQDAFLYLMVTLPELDSELGVLRFLKWKVRLLCLDVIKAHGKAYLSDIDEHGEFQADQADVGSDLERAEDSAIVRLALAKLQPRHREVLIASIYEEKSTLEIAGQIGLTENATRQLMLRARTALKKALVGEVNTQGMSISQILSVAARKAAHDAKQVGAQAMSVIAIAVLGIAAFVNFNPASQTQQIAVPQPTNNSQQENNSNQTETESNEAQLPANPNAQTVSETRPASGNLVTNLASLDSAVDSSPFDPWLVDAIFEQSGAAEILLASEDNDLFTSGQYAAVSSAGFWADFSFDADDARPISSVRIGFVVDQNQYFSSPSQRDYFVGRLSNGLDRYTFIGVVRDIQDLNGTSYSNTRMDGVQITLEVTVDPAKGKVVATELFAQASA